jgi:hypothetical protein
MKHWKRGRNEEMEVEEEPYEAGAGRRRAWIMLALKRAIMPKLCVLVRVSSFLRE